MLWISLFIFGLGQVSAVFIGGDLIGVNVTGVYNISFLPMGNILFDVC